jgi:shikimate kinase
MMGSWKSTVAKKLATELVLKFIDTDDEIEEAKSKKETYTRRELLQLAFLPILK